MTKMPPNPNSSCPGVGPASTLSAPHKYHPSTLHFFPFPPPPSLPPYNSASPTMLAAMPTGFPFGPVPYSPFQSFDNDFAPWDCIDNPFSDKIQSPKPVTSTSMSDDSNLDPVSYPSNSGKSSGEKRKGDAAVDERKRRRMVSNRESARRSRMRKQRHLENLRNQVNRLKVQNRELSNRLRLVLYHCYLLRRSNDQLRSEQSMLRHKLSNMQQILLLQQLQQQQNIPSWPCNSTPIIETCERTSSLIL
ncbi:hypothetical protein ACJRO7_034299 [Eucalyptus globulus]|uniref:BZIP domain-containing protein n=1 Tax=Eucalyptus globulus TaxID=34317 RepID=A0ABD3J8I6_EUCGL